jgi:hypothetical protein
MRHGDKYVWIYDDIRWKLRYHKEKNNKRPDICHVLCGLEIYDILSGVAGGLKIFDITVTVECSWEMELYDMEFEIK